jgi:hypothetical protein
MISEVGEGMILARPARALDGAVLLAAGAALDRAAIDRLRQEGLSELWVVQPGELVPDPTVPEYMDRYCPDFAERLQRLFARTLLDRAMQNLYIEALAHAGECYRRYRLDGDGAPR